MQDGIYNTYLFAYNAWVSPDQTTIPLFDKLQLRSIIDADISGGTLGQVQINANAIQADELNISGLTGTGKADHFYTAADLSSIYTVIANKQTTP